MKPDNSMLEIRRRIFEYISKNPGSFLREISRTLEINLSTLRHHLNFLEDHEIIVSEKSGNLRTYFITGRLSKEDKIICRLLRQKRFRDVILTIIMRPGLSHTQICNTLSIKPSTLSKYIRILERDQIIFYQKEGNNKCYYVSDEDRIIKLLISYKRSFWDSFVDNVLKMYFEI